MTEVPSIQNLKQQVQQLISLEITTFEGSNINSWNDRFHRIIKEYNLVDYFPIDTVPPCYKIDKSCGHVLQVDLGLVYTTSLYLTMLETLGERNTVHSSNGASKFIHDVLFTNHIWDIGLQFTLAQNKWVSCMYLIQRKVYPYHPSVFVLAHVC